MKKSGAILCGGTVGALNFFVKYATLTPEFMGLFKNCKPIGLFCKEIQ